MLNLNRLATYYKIAQLDVEEEIVRPEGWGATSREKYDVLLQTFPGYVYRGMTSQEYNNTVGAGEPIKSNLSYSFGSEGTSFSEDPGTAEDYVNFGRDDPRKTGIPNYLVEVERTESMYQDTDGYIKDKEPVPISKINAIWEFTPDEEGNLWMRRL